MSCPIDGKRIRSGFKLYDRSRIYCGHFCSKACAQAEAWGPRFTTFTIRKAKR